jgi:hypothetical protein
MKAVYLDQPLTEIIVVDCIPVYELFDWLILNVNIPFIKNMDAFISGKGCVKHLKFYGVRDSITCAMSAAKYENKETIDYLKKVYPNSFKSNDYISYLALKNFSDDFKFKR